MTTNHCVGQGIFKCGGTSLETLVTDNTCNVLFWGLRISSFKAVSKYCVLLKTSQIFFKQLQSEKPNEAISLQAGLGKEGW